MFVYQNKFVESHDLLSGNNKVHLFLQHYRSFNVHNIINSLMQNLQFHKWEIREYWRMLLRTYKVVHPNWEIGMTVYQR